jgi:hypothetical protein
LSIFYLYLSFQVCVPLWCTSSDTPQSDGVPQPHHRIVRIPPSESVVLNSAERAPYLLVLEILHGDLDFNSAKRSNKEILRRMAVKESERTGASRDIIVFNATSTTTPSVASAQREANAEAKIPPPEDVNEFDTGIETTSMERMGPPVITPVIPPTPSTSTVPLSEDNGTDEEEMDLVEQLYGTDRSLRARPIDLSESIVLPAVPKNRDLDLVTWSRSSSAGPPSPYLTTDRDQQVTEGMQSHSPSGPSAANGSSLQGGSSALSLDDYSERMRTAAVMLAQLNASLVREEVPPMNPGGASQDPSSSWLPGYSWLGSTPSPPNNEIQQSVPSGALNAEQQHPAVSSTRLRLQYSEAAAIRDRIMKEMLALEEERMERTKESRDGGGSGYIRMGSVSALNSAEDESIIRKELNKVDPSAVVFSESWATKKVSMDVLWCCFRSFRCIHKSRIRQGSPYGHLGDLIPSTCLLFTF